MEMLIFLVGSMTSSLSDLRVNDHINGFVVDFNNNFNISFIQTVEADTI